MILAILTDVTLTHFLAPLLMILDLHLFLILADPILGVDNNLKKSKKLCLKESKVFLLIIDILTILVYNNTCQIRRINVKKCKFIFPFKS